jgi:hypothetical protein
VEALGGRPERLGHPVLDVPGLDGQHLAARDAVVGADAEPGREVLAGGERRERGAQFRKEGQREGGEPLDLGEVDPEDPVQLGAELDPRGGAAAVWPGVRRQGRCGGVDGGREAVEQRLDLGVAPASALVVPEGRQGLAEREGARPVVPPGPWPGSPAKP